MAGTMGEFHRVIGGSRIKVPTVGISLFVKIGLVITPGPDPCPRRVPKGFPMNSFLDMGDGRNSAFRADVQSNQAFGQGAQMKVGVDEPGQNGLAAEDRQLQCGCL